MLRSMMNSFDYRNAIDDINADSSQEGNVTDCNQENYKNRMLMMNGAKQSIRSESFSMNTFIAYAGET